LSHAASAFYPSPFEEAAIVTVDGVGEWATTTIGHGHGNKITLLKELHFPHSVGLLYSAFTYYTGFMVNSGEYKLMGLAPYGNPDSPHVQEFKRKITSDLVDIRKDGSILLNMNYFSYATGLRMVYEDKWERLFGVPRREGESEISQVYMDMALAIQQVTEEIVMRLCRTAAELTKSKYLVLAGGVALNCVANGKVLRSGMFEDIWIQPAAGDAGGALGAAYAVWYIREGKERVLKRRGDAMNGALLGPEFSDKDIRRSIDNFGAKACHYQEFEELANAVATRLAEGKVIGWFQGRMEYGPRALGNRSILGDPRNPEMQKKLTKIKTARVSDRLRRACCKKTFKTTLSWIVLHHTCFWSLPCGQKREFRYRRGTMVRASTRGSISCDPICHQLRTLITRLGFKAWTKRLIPDTGGLFRNSRS
jgi:carbamoyltransferase